jgi:signal transduction histidine kinase
LVLLLVAFARVEAQEDAWPGRVEAVRSDWNAQHAPDDGWVDVREPDDWNARWPHFDGVVWYRLTWNQAEPLADLGLYIDYLNMSGVISVNGAMLAQDDGIVEPLSRMWNIPRYFRLSAPLLHTGENILLVRVSGMAAYDGGIGSVRLGAPGELRERYDRAFAVRHDWQIVGFAVVLTLGLFFLALWLFRRREVAYGWYAALQFSWLNWSWNQITTGIWPFRSTDAFEAANTATLLLFCACYTMFALRFSAQRWPRREAVLWIAVAAGLLWVFCAPHDSMRDVRALLTVLANLSVLLTNGLLVYFAFGKARTDQRILAVVGLMNLAAGTHDTLVFVGVISSSIYYSGISTLLSAMGLALILAWNFARSLHRIEGFNTELQRNADEARAELASTLNRQHELELVHARLGERVSLAHDLHDGLGGMLIGNIAALEQAPDNLPARAVLDMLRELRDDLRLIIDTASAQHYGEHSLAELLAPLRYRITRLFEAHDIESIWRVDNLENVYLTTTQSLDLLRIAQEALVNALKHAKAKRVEVNFRNNDQALHLEIIDDGIGLQQDGDGGFGTGMRSMEARARRLGATLSIASQPGVTTVKLDVPRPGVAKSG